MVCSPDRPLLSLNESMLDTLENLIEESRLSARAAEITVQLSYKLQEQPNNILRAHLLSASICVGNAGSPRNDCQIEIFLIDLNFLSLRWV